METRLTSEIVWREDLYPRITTDPMMVQRYADNIEVLPPIEINQHNEIIDGWHRWTAHRKNEVQTINVIVTETVNEAEFIKLAIIRNAVHGMQLSSKDKQNMATKLYSANHTSKEELASILSVTVRSISSWVATIDKVRKEEQDRIIKEMWFACYSQDEIATVIGKTKQALDDKIKDCQLLEKFPKSDNLLALYNDEHWTPPLYDIWDFNKNDNEVKHFGNTHVGIVDNLLYTFTQPFDIVIDPFAGGGSTIDICKKRLRRYWVSDRLPIVEREKEIRKHDVITDGISGPYHWGEVALVYLDPPYWKQTEGKYSNDPTDLSNMPLRDFTASLIDIIESYGKKLRPGAHVACITSPTQWPNENHECNYHDIDLACGVKGLKLIRRAVCPYSTQQYNGTQVNIAKENKLWLVRSRTLLVWEKD